MADKQLTLVVRAKNALATGFASANNSVANFRKNMMASLRGVTGTVAAVVAAYMLLKKAMETVIEWARRAGNEIRATVAGNAEARVRSLAQAFDLLSAWFDRASKRAKGFADTAGKIVKATQEMEDATRKAARDQEALAAAGAGGTTEDLAAMDKAAALEDKRIAAARKVAEIERQIEASKAESAARAQQLTDEAEIQTAAIIEAKKQEDIRKALMEEYGSAWAALNASEAAKLKENAEIARKAAEEQRKAAADSVKRQNALADENAVAERERAAQAIALSAAKAEAEIVGMREAADERAKFNEEQAAEQKKLVEERAALEERAVEAQNAAHEKGWRDQKARAEKVLAMEDHAPAVKIKDFIAHKKEVEKAKKKDERQAKRDDKEAEWLEQRKRRGENIGKASQEWLDAYHAVRGAQNQRAVAQQNLDAIQKKKDSENLDNIRKLLDKNLEELRKLGALG